MVARWHQRVSEEPYHLGRKGRAVADHIPALIDAVIESLADDAAPAEPIESPMVREDVRQAAAAHAAMRASQGLTAAEVVTELRILRQELCRALREHFPDEATGRDVLAAILAANDALDGAATIVVSTVTDAVARETADLVSVTAHDLKTPLTTVKGYVQLAARELAKTDSRDLRLHEYLAHMGAGIEHMRALIDDVMALAHVSGTVELNLTEVNPVELCWEVVRSLGVEARDRVQIEPYAGAEKPGWWDALQLRRVLENLVSNALKYAPEEDIRITIRNRRQSCELRIIDRGIGVSHEDRKNLFERFYRSPEAVQRKIEGIGLGLFVSRAIAQAHGGTLQLESAGPGQGTTAILSLPRRTPRRRAG
jgi:signal transduction histidine kinase